MSAPSAPAPLPPALADRQQASQLIIPFACTGGEGEPPLAELPAAAQLPHLRRLLGMATLQQACATPLTSLTPPHEWALAHALGLPTGCAPLDGAACSPAGAAADVHAPTALPADSCLPWAAWDAAHLLPTPQTPAAWFTPCHQEIGAHHVNLLPPEQLNLTEAHSRALMAALAPLALEDGIHLRWVAPDRWLATGNVLAGVRAASLDRVAGRSIGPWLHTLPPMLRRLQSEAQMLFYTHPAHDERVARRQAPANAFWVSGAGHAPPVRTPQTAGGSPLAGSQPVTVLPSLRAAALRGDASGWQRAWTETDHTVLPAWLARAEAGETLHVYLCGEQAFWHLRLAPASTWQRVTAIFLSKTGRQRLFNKLHML